MMKMLYNAKKRMLSHMEKKDRWSLKDQEYQQYIDRIEACEGFEPFIYFKTASDKEAVR